MVLIYHIKKIYIELFLFNNLARSYYLLSFRTVKNRAFVRISQRYISISISMEFQDFQAFLFHHSLLCVLFCAFSHLHYFKF